MKYKVFVNGFCVYESTSVEDCLAYTEGLTEIEEWNDVGILYEEEE